MVTSTPTINAPALRILHIVQSISAPFGGAAFAVANIAEVERRLGYDVSILTLNADAPASDVARFATIHKMAASMPERLSRSTEASAFLLEHGGSYDLAVIHGVWSLLQVEAAKICRQRRLPYIIRPHGSLDPFDLRKKSLAKRLLGPIIVRPMLNAARAIQCTTKREQLALELYGANTKTQVCALPVPALEARGDRGRFRNSLGVSNDEVVLLFLGRIDYKKGLEVLFEALAQVRSRSLMPSLVIAGSGQRNFELRVREWMAQHSLEAQVKFLGFLSGQEKADAFAGSDCFVLPSQNENFGIAIVEAMNEGLPAVVSDQVYLSDDILEADAGWVCSYSTESLLRQLVEITTDRSARQRRGANARRFAQRFNPAKLCDRYETLYRSALA